MASRAQCVVDILLETDGTPNKGWQTPPNIPKVIVEDRDNTIDSFIERPPDDGVIVVKKKYKFDFSEKLSLSRENLVWTFEAVIISPTEDLLEQLLDQGREVFDRYCTAKFATDTNSHTYDYARLVEGEPDTRWNIFAHNVFVQLAQFLAEVTIA